MSEVQNKVETSGEETGGFEMKSLKRFQLTYRKDQLLQRGEVEGCDLEQAVAVARKWCGLEPGRRFISVKDVVLAGPDILKESVKREVPGVINFEHLSRNGAKAAVQRGDITVEEALEREIVGRNRKTLIQWLESKRDNPDTQDPGVPF